MILVDTSIWIAHFKQPIGHLHDLVNLRDALTHPLIVGELAMGGVPDRRATLRAFTKMPVIAQATHAEVMAFVEWQRAFSKGIGFIDAHLLAAVTLTDRARLWTRDKALLDQARRLEVAYAP